MNLVTRVAGTLTLAVLAVAGLREPAEAMSGYRWKYRPLVVFADSSGDAALSRQRAIVAGSRGGMRERHMVIVWVVGDSVSTDGGPGPGLGAAAMRARYGASRGAFRSILVGKDGGVKLTQSSPLSADTLFRTIDAMPMRRDEMRR